MMVIFTTTAVLKKKRYLVVFSCEHNHTCENFNVPKFYLFNWDNIPGKDNEKLRAFLKKKFCLDWTITAKIEKIDNGRTIRVFSEKNSLWLRLNNEKTKINLLIDDGETDGLIAKTENGDLKIFQSYCCYKNKIETSNKNKDVYIEFKGGKDFVNSITKACKFIKRYYRYCIFVVNPYKKLNDVTYFQLGFALGKKVKIIGLSPIDCGNLLLPIKDILPSEDIADNMDDFIGLILNKLDVEPFQLSTEESVNDAKDVFSGRFNYDAPY